MASKIKYNNIPYDILNAIQMGDKEYLFISNPDDINDIRYIEKINVNGEVKYSLPPRDLSIESNPTRDLKNLQINSVASHIVDIVKNNINDGVLKSDIEVRKQLLYIESFIYSDLSVKTIIDDNDNLNHDNYETVVKSLNNYFDSQFLYSAMNKKISEQTDKTSQQITTPDGLNYEWLYNLNSSELREIASQKHTSEELIYILDALDKRLETERSIEKYTNGVAKTYKKDNKAAFIDTLLLSLITGSFGILLLISLF